MPISANTRFSLDHISLTTNDMEATKKFYKELFADFLGWETIYDESYYFMVGKLPGLRIGFGNSAEAFNKDTFDRYRIGLHHFGIEVDSKEVIDEIYTKLLEMNATILDKPQFYPDYGENHYALFYQDPNGLKMEFLSR